MNFTRRTYRVAIERSINKERRFIELRKEQADQPVAWVVDMFLMAQIRHTTRLQRRKRRNRK